MGKKVKLAALLMAAVIVTGGCNLLEINGNEHHENSKKPDVSLSSDVSAESVEESVMVSQQELSQESFEQESEQSAADQSAADQSSEEASIEKESRSESSEQKESSAPDVGDVSEQSSVTSENPVQSSAPVPVSESSVAEPDKPEEKKADFSVMDEYETKYFVKRLSEKQKYYFSILYKAAKNHEERVKFDTPLTDEELSGLMYLLNYDCPELIHLNGDYYPEYSDETMTEISALAFSYCMTKQEYDKNKKTMESYLADLVTSIGNRSDDEKEKYVYDTIFYNCIYSESAGNAGSAYGSLIEGTARCEGICKGFMWAMRRLGVECICVSGSQNWDVSAFYSDHSWDIIKLDDKWYHVDITVDNVRHAIGDENPPNYGFYNVTDAFIGESREINQIYLDLGIPVCSSEDRDYHNVNGLYIEKGELSEEKIRELLRTHLTERGIEDLSVKFRSSADYDNAKENIDEWTGNFFREETENVYVYDTYFNELSRTIIIDARKEEIIEG